MSRDGIQERHYKFPCCCPIQQPQTYGVSGYTTQQQPCQRLAPRQKTKEEERISTSLMSKTRMGCRLIGPMTTSINKKKRV